MLPRLRREAPRRALRIRPVPVGEPPPEEALAAARAGGFAGRRDEVLDLIAAGRRLRLIGAGEAATAPEWEAVGAACMAAGEERRVALDARGLPGHAALHLAAGAALRAWRFDALRSAPEPGPRSVTLLVDDPRTLAEPWARLRAALRGARLARRLVAEPGNRLTLELFARRLRRLERHGLRVEVLGRR
ncbi:MAG: hypothetical protein K2X11_07845, partial [Acetobacteraceae bacterium]|nr:hypothetical protein [Acetobacteraceae bacterium]